jgi:hypothetical protein
MGINRYYKAYLIKIYLFILTCFAFNGSKAQSLPVGIPGFEEYYRRGQLIGQLDSTVSFTIRPLIPTSLKTIGELASDSIIRGHSLYESNKWKSNFKILPAIWDQQYVSNHPIYSNDGSLIPARGYQTRISAGFFAKLGFLSIQVKPEYVFAENKDFKQLVLHYKSMDWPTRFGDEVYSNLSWGQSSLRLNWGAISFGLSNENIFWGPGIQNSLLMGNSAPGFKHLTLNTIRPVRTPIGSLEAQIIAGRLEGSRYSATLPEDWRYLSGVAFSYQPKWVPGLFLGLTRSFQMYNKDVKRNVGDLFPFLQAFQKFKTNEDEKPRDQLVSLFGRWLLPASKAEFYFEYGLNDHAYNTRDFLMSPEHSRAYTIGFQKLIPYKGTEDEFLQFGFELTRMEQSLDWILRNAGEWYAHGQVVHGYTNAGQVLGAKAGPGGNSQSFKLSWVKGLRQIGLQFERSEINGDLAKYSRYDDWLDFGIGANAFLPYRKFLVNFKLMGIQSVNYLYQSGLNGSPKKNAFNLSAQLGITYGF